MQGDLSQETLADVIRTLYVNRRSGIVHLSQGKRSKRIYFRKGSMIFANSDVESDRLGEFLIREGVIDREAFDKVSVTMKSTGHRFGRTVVELGHCTTEEMENKVVEQIQAIIYSLFEWNEGTYRFEQHESPVDEDIVLNLSTADIILEGTRRMQDMGKVRRALGDSSRILKQNEDPLLLYQKMTTLSQSEYFILSRVDGMSSIDDIFAVSPLDEDETLLCIYGLLSAGVLVLQSGGHSATARSTSRETTKAPNHEAPPEQGPPPSTPRRDHEPERVATRGQTDVPRPGPSTPKPSAPPPPTRAPEPPAGADGPSPEEIAVREEIVQKHASLADSTYYDLLGVTLTANDTEIKKAYYAMAKKYHPDRHHSPHLRDVHGLLEELFSKITVAYQTLSATADRHRYDQTLKHGDGSGVSAGSIDEEAQRKAEQSSEAALKRVAEEQYAEGKKHFDEMHFFDAIQCLREAVRLHPKKSYHKLLAQALSKNPLWLKEAEEQFRNALKLDQFDAECWTGLGDIYAAKGMSTRAQKMYEQAATYDPENDDLQKKAGTKKELSGLGGLRKILGRRKG